MTSSLIGEGAPLRLISLLGVPSFLSANTSRPAEYLGQERWMNPIHREDLSVLHLFQRALDSGSAAQTCFLASTRISSL